MRINYQIIKQTHKKDSTDRKKISLLKAHLWASVKCNFSPSEWPALSTLGCRRGLCFHLTDNNDSSFKIQEKWLKPCLKTLKLYNVFHVFWQHQHFFPKYFGTKCQFRQQVLQNPLSRFCWHRACIFSLTDAIITNSKQLVEDKWTFWNLI